MESDSSARSLLSLFSSSKLTTFTPPTSRNFYVTTPPASASTAQEDASVEGGRPRKKRRRVMNAGQWTCAEIRALETYRNLKKGGDMDVELRNVLLPNRSAEEIRLQLARVEKTIQERRRTRLRELQEAENTEFAEEQKARAIEREKDFQRRRTGLDQHLGLGVLPSEVAIEDVESRAPVKQEDEIVRASLDQALGLVEESADQRRRRELEEALGLYRGI